MPGIGWFPLTPIRMFPPAMEENMSFRITGLPAADFAPLFDLSDPELAARGAVRRIAEQRTPGTPCRISLTDAQAGEQLLLVNYEHHPVSSPYRMRFAVFVRKGEEIGRAHTSELQSRF